jgi:hypothetical protein
MISSNVGFDLNYKNKCAMCYFHHVGVLCTLSNIPGAEAAALQRKLHLFILRKGIAWTQSQFLYSCAREWIIFIFPGTVHIFSSAE